jgi:hypothetical protein
VQKWQYATLKVRDRDVLERNGQNVQQTRALHDELNVSGMQGFEVSQVVPFVVSNSTAPYFLFILKAPLP